MDILNKLPLSSLRLFEAAGRTCSFTLAAGELGITASAASHAIGKLEKQLAVRLFFRNTREMALTADGELLLRHVQNAFSEIKQGVNSLAKSQQRPLRIHTVPSFANQWLLSRLSSFIQRYPDVQFRFSANTDPVRFEDDEFDLDILYGQPVSSSYHSIPLSVEQLTPLCSPQVAEKISKPEDLYSCTLIQCDAQLYQWRGWFEENNLAPPEQYHLSFDRSFMAIKAAVDGLGVVLESMLLAEKEIKNGDLVCPLVETTRELHYICHYLSFPRYQQHPALEVFKTWLLNELNSANHR
ncbi:LysR substrate-binding domain-containing protein [Dryocola clanedunensis]